jgi:hypothetical protein
MLTEQERISTRDVAQSFRDCAKLFVESASEEAIEAASERMENAIYSVPKGYLLEQIALAIRTMASTLDLENPDPETLLVLADTIQCLADC